MMKNIDLDARLQRANDNDEIPEYKGATCDGLLEIIARYADNIAEHFFKAGYMCALMDMEAVNGTEDKGTA